jgi:hypothetical protein
MGNLDCSGSELCPVADSCEDGKLCSGDTKITAVLFNVPKNCFAFTLKIKGSARFHDHNGTNVGYDLTV